VGRRYEDSVEVGMPPDAAMRTLTDSVTRVASNRSVQVDGPSVSATVRVSIWSWGERIEGRVEATDSGSRVQVSSTCRAQLFDWGKNRRNVEDIMRPFQHLPS
jgi:carbon monoxide dehydrogenase subunit G